MGTRRLLLQVGDERSDLHKRKGTRLYAIKGDAKAVLVNWSVCRTQRRFNDGLHMAGRTPARAAP